MLEALAHNTLHVFGGWDDLGLRVAAEEAVVIARQTGDAATEAAALVTLASGEPIGGSVERIRALLAQARAVASQAKAYQPLLEAAIIESDMLEGTGLHELAATVAREGLTAAREYGLARTYGAVLASNLAEPLLSLGHWEEASEVIEAALRLFPPRLTRTDLWRLAGDLALARGDLAAAAESVASMRLVLDDMRYHDHYHLPLARLETEVPLAQGGPQGALSAVEDALDRFDVRQSPRYAWPLLVAGARACAAAAAARDGDLRAKAAAMLDRLRAEAGRLAADGLAQQAHQLTFAAEAARVGRVAAATEPGELPQPGDMRAVWDKAAQAWEAAGEPYPLARTLRRSAEAALRAGDREGGAARLRRAAELAQRLGAPPLSDDIALLAGRARIALGQPSEAADAQAVPGQAGRAQIPEPRRLGLTARELEVLRLVAAGRSNREIAGELFISAKTASVHVSNILAKLGVTARGEAAATAHRLHLFDSFPP